MKKILLILLISIIMSGCNPGKIPALTSEGKKVYFQWQDKTWDDHGPGSYTYPRSWESQYEKGCFDIRDFQVYDSGIEVYFRIRFRGKLNMDNTSVEANGWNSQLIDIYIDTNHVEGLGRTDSLPGRNVRFQPECAWEKVILITPMARSEAVELIEQKTEHVELKAMLENDNLIIPELYFVAQSVIIAKVLKRDLGVPADKWGYQVLSMGFSRSSQEPDSLFNMEVKSVAGTGVFGGGDNFSGDPNVIDMLESSEGEQEKILSTYFSAGRNFYSTLAEIPMIYQSSDQNKDKSTEKTMVEEKPVFQFKSASKQNQETCRNNMRELKKAAEKYSLDHPEDQNVTVYDLLLNGYVQEIPRCPGGGKYDISGEEEGQIKVKCYNPSGESHGTFEEGKNG